MMSAISFEQILTLAYDSLRLKLNLSIQLLLSIQERSILSQRVSIYIL